MSNSSNNNIPKNSPSLFYLIKTFIKIGSTSFGGFMALVSTIQNEMVDRKKTVSEEVLLNGISLASIMPGPLAVNVVTYIGFSLRGWPGALVSMAAVILPSFILVVCLSFFYFEYGDLAIANKFFYGVMPGVIAIIISVAINMSKKSIKDLKQVLICLISGLILFFIGGFYMTLLIIIAGGIAGWGFYFFKSEHKKENADPYVFRWSEFPLRIFGILIIVLMIIILLPYIPYIRISEDIILLRQLSLVFGGMSLSLFGGGYVFIPAIQEIIVDQLHWLTLREFTDGIAIGQITPGPILISAAFIGYKISGILGALIATISIFLPSGLLMALGSYFLNYFKNSDLFKAIFKGIRPAVIGMIFSAGFTMGMGLSFNWQTILLFLVALLLNFKYKLSAVFLIPLSGIAGILFF